MGKKRSMASPGVSYYDANHNRLVTVGSDVLDIQHKIHEEFPDLEVWLDTDQDPPTYIVVEHCKDGVDRLALERPYLDDRLLDDLRRADTHRKGQEDPDAMVDAYNAQVERDRAASFADAIGEAGERFLFAMRKDGFGGVNKVFFPNK